MLDVVIPHLNYPYLRQCIKSLRCNTPTGVLSSITLVDQSGSYHTHDVDYHLICKEQVGFARAANLGIALGHAPYVMVLNDDCVFLDRRWWWGIMKTFNLHHNLLCVSPSSPYNPGCENKYTTPDMITPEVYSSLLGDRLVDGMCMWAPIFDRQKLNSVQGCKLGTWFDERFWPGGGEDYDLCRRGSLSGFRSVGAEWSWVWHWWHSTTWRGATTAKHDGGTFSRKWVTDDGEEPDLFGHSGKKEVPANKYLEGN